MTGRFYLNIFWTVYAIEAETTRSVNQVSTHFLAVVPYREHRKSIPGFALNFIKQRRLSSKADNVVLHTIWRHMSWILDSFR